MKVGIDARVMETPAGNRGVGYYTRNIIKNLIQLQSNVNFIFYLTFFKRKKEISQIQAGKLYSIPTLYRPRRIVRYFDLLFSFFWNFSLMRSKPDILHITHLFEWYYLSIPKNIKTIITVFDVIPIIYKKIYLKKTNELNWYKKRLDQIKFADKIITISETSKSDLENILGISKEKIKVIYCGINEKFKKIDKQVAKEKLKSNYGIIKPFVLAVSAASYHKNTSRIFQAFKKYIIKTNNEDLLLVVVCKLILSERKSWEKELEELGIRDRVMLTDFVVDENMPYFYSAAELLIFPSLYEGFGLPIAEAMACGCPVITSNVSSMPEVGGRAAYYVNPKSTRSIASGIETVLTDEKLRKRMTGLGFKQAKKFNWEHSAEKTIKVYKDLYKKQ